MKILIFLFPLSLLCSSIYAQTFQVRPTGQTNREWVLTGGPNRINLGSQPLTQFEFRLNSPLTAGTTYSLFLSSNPGTAVNITSTGNWISFSPSQGDLYGQNIDVRDNTGTNILNFTIEFPSRGTNVNPNNNQTGVSQNSSANNNQSVFPTQSVQQYLLSLFPVINPTRFGIEVPSANTSSRFTGSNYTHIFLDQFGNNIIGTVPQGISNRQYVVHIFYLSNSLNPNQITYSINQTEGSFSSALVFNNAGQFGNLQFQSGSTKSVTYQWQHSEFLLRTSSNDIKFEIYRNVLDNQVPFDIEKRLIGTKSISMSRVFNVSFDVGLISTRLEDPTFELIASPNDPNMNVVSRSNTGNRGIVTAMATFYTSPIILIKRYLLRDTSIPAYKLTGRNFLDDHKIFERIYPAIGIALNETSFENLIFGFNWEVARGGSLFIGYHYGLVNTFNEPLGFQFGTTMTSQADFDLAIDQEWRGEFAIGANLDIRIITNLFQQGN